jgi:predicted Ser/Thr protein kinase/tetratricopeptide (TPR) repeat protein
VETIGRYRVVRQLGHGGMGQVFLAHDPTLERDVALKLLHREATQTGLRDEAKALAALSHPGIVTIFEIGEHDGQDFIAMEYLPGKSLRELMQAHAPRDALLAICGKVAIAVEVAHRAGILHRDIKPENVVVNDAGEVKVVDFGLARRLDHKPAATGRAATAREELVDLLRRTMPPENGADTIVDAGMQTAYGTPAYMAPEVLIGVPSNEASDVYSLGVVIHECIAGRRPHDAGTLIEAIALVIDGPAAQLDDPLGPLIARMLAHDQRQRPSLDEITRALSKPAAPALPPAAPAARRRWPIVAIAGVATLALGIGAWRLMASAKQEPAPPAPVAPPIIVTASIAVAQLVLDVPTYGHEPPNPDVIADTLSKLLGQVEGARLTGIAVAKADRVEAKSVGAGYLVTGSITEVGTQLHAELAVISVTSGSRVATVIADGPSPQFAPLLDALATKVARAVAPGAILHREPSSLRAQMFYRQGRSLLDNGRFTEARPYFEQAVDADPRFFDGWYTLALALGWTEAPEPAVAFATTQAIELAPPGPKQDLMRGVQLYLAGKHGEARAILEPLEHVTGATSPDRRELLYYLGEVNWHDGRHDLAFDYFKRTLELDPRFRPATIHAWEYAVARRDEKAARYYVGLAGENTEWIEFSLRHYAELANTGSPSQKLQSQLVLGRPTSPEIETIRGRDDLDAMTFRVALAAAAGDLPRARADFAEAWTRITAQDPTKLSGGTSYALEALGEVVISAAMEPEARQLVTFLAEQSRLRPARGYHRLSILAAPVLRDAGLILHDDLTDRETRLALASEAELAGDRATAAKILASIVADPSFFWDYPERAALVRNLRALHRRTDLAALCEDTVRPALFRPAFLVVRRACAR